MMNSSLFQIPEKLKKIQEKILSFREREQLYLQNGDSGYGKSPSNIAFIKYWGKEENLFQIPQNSSLSFILNHFFSETKVTVQGVFLPKDTKIKKIFNHSFNLTGNKNNILENKVTEKMQTWLENILHPFADEIALNIETQNNFPTACGIASSASGYAALTMAIANLLQLSTKLNKDEFQYWCYEWARLGSGSATRSIVFSEEDKFVEWEKLNNETITKQIHAHENWGKLKHCVLILNEDKKTISSSDGHKLAKSSLFHQIRVNNIEYKLSLLKKALLNFNFDVVKDLTEEDALLMHSVMHTGNPSLKYLNQASAKIISAFIQERNSKSIKAFWTLDAGPNIHILYMSGQEPFLTKIFQNISEICEFEILGNF